MKMTHLLVVLATGGLSSACGDHGGSASGPWSGEIYPDMESPSDTRLLGEFPSFDECVHAATEALGGEGAFSCSTGRSSGRY